MTGLSVLVGCYAMHYYFDPTPNGKPRAKLNVAGMSGAALGLVLMSGIATLFV